MKHKTKTRHSRRRQKVRHSRRRQKAGTTSPKKQKTNTSNKALSALELANNKNLFELDELHKLHVLSQTTKLDKENKTKTKVQNIQSTLLEYKTRFDNLFNSNTIKDYIRKLEDIKEQYPDLEEIPGQQAEVSSAVYSKADNYIDLLNQTLLTKLINKCKTFLTEFASLSQIEKEDILDDLSLHESQYNPTKITELKEDLDEFIETPEDEFLR